MQSSLAFALLPRLHADLLRLLALVPEPLLGSTAPGLRHDFATLFRHVAAAEEYWRRVVLERESEYLEIEASDCPDRPAIAGRLAAAFAATEELLRGSLVDALAARPVRTRFPVRNALEALSLCQIHSVHHRAEIATGLRALGIDPGEWL